MNSENFASFLQIPKYQNNIKVAKRLNERYKRVVEPEIIEIEGRTVLDLGAHDGRWAYAYALAGAKHVTAVEAREELATQLSDFPNDEVKSRISMFNDDNFKFLERAVREQKKFDIVLILGFFYHTMEHFRLLSLIKSLDPKIIVIDSEFIDAKNPIIQMLTERTDKILNSTPSYREEEYAIVGVPSDGAIEKFAEFLNMNIIWYQGDDGQNVPQDYRRKERKRRRTCFLLKSEVPLAS